MSAYTLLRCNPPQIYKEEEEERNKSLISCFYRCTKKKAYRRFAWKHYGVEKNDNRAKQF